MLRIISFILLLSFVQTSVAGGALSTVHHRFQNCSRKLDPISIRKSLTGYASRLYKKTLNISRAFAPEGEGFIHIKKPLGLDPQLGRFIFNEFPKGTNFHINRGSFAIKKGLIDSQVVEIAYAFSPTKFVFEPKVLRPEVIEYVEGVALIQRNALNSALGPEDELEIGKIGFIYYDETSKDYFYAETFFQPHLDDKGVYIRSVTMAFGEDGTVIFPNGLSEESVKLKQGEVVFFEGNERQREKGHFRPMLWHNVPNVVGKGKGRLALRIDYVKVKKSIIRRVFK